MKKITVREESIIERRAVICFFVIISMLMSCVARVAVITQSDYATVAADQSGYRITVGTIRGTIYDCNMMPITNQKRRIIAAVSPTPEAIVAISAALEGEAKSSVLYELRNGNPAVCEVKSKISANGIACTEIYENISSDMPAEHIIGYTDGDNRGVSGIQAAYDDFLYCASSVDAVFQKNGKGELLYGIEPYFENDLSCVNKGVVTTLDLNIQNIVQAASEKITTGAVVVADPYNGEIKAMLSKPDFDVLRVADYLNAENAPLLNRALASYSVGSAFKPCVAAAAIENNITDFIFDCTGKTYIIDRDFHCHKRSGHGLMDLKAALAQSCNCYFYNFAFKIGASAIYKQARSFSFEGKMKIGDGLEASEGILPDFKAVSTNAAALANLSIGQGKLLLSPVSMLTLYSAIASDGTYVIPHIIKATVSEGAPEEYASGNKTRAMSEETARQIRGYLSAVVNEGTGIQAKPESTTAAGKTATAQTGRFDSDGKEINNGWFCGFFPAESPKYTVVVMTEGASEVSAASVFSQIADSVTEYEKTK